MCYDTASYLHILIDIFNILRLYIKPDVTESNQMKSDN